MQCSIEVYLNQQVGVSKKIKVKNWKISQNTILCIQFFFPLCALCLVCCDGKSQEDVEQVQTVGT